MEKVRVITGRGVRTHIVSPAIAAATAIAGHFATPDDLD